MADLEILRYLAAKTGIGLNCLSKDEKISIILEQTKELFPDVVLKGGTALNRVYLQKLEASRFSEDIDLDFISAENLDKKISTIKKRIDKITDFDVKGPRILHRTLRFDCYYINEFDEKDLVRLEFYLTQTKAVKRTETLVKSPLVETHPVIFNVYSLEDLMARKFIALYDRTEGKDIYDLFYCLDLEFSFKKLHKALDMMIEFYKLNHSTFVKELLQSMENARKNSYYIGNSTNHFIPRKRRPDWNAFIATLALKIEKKFHDDFL